MSLTRTGKWDTNIVGRALTETQVNAMFDANFENVTESNGSLTGGGISSGLTESNLSADILTITPSGTMTMSRHDGGNDSLTRRRGEKVEPTYTVVYKDTDATVEAFPENTAQDVVFYAAVGTHYLCGLFSVESVNVSDERDSHQRERTVVLANLGAAIHVL